MVRGARHRHWAGLIVALCLWAAPAAAQVSATLTWHQPDIQTFYLSDFDPSTTATHPDLFSVLIVNSSGGDLNVYLEFEVTATSYTNPLITARTDNFLLTSQGRQISNRDLSDTDREYVLRDFSTSGDAEEVMQKALETGLLPSDTYGFTLRVYPGTGGPELASATYMMVVSNPSRVDLIAPGAEFGGVLPVVASPTPQFFWSTDALATGLNASFRIRVVKVVEAGSAEEAMQSYASWEGSVMNQTTVIYPSSVEAIGLEQGATYAWQVERLVSTSGGVRELESEIFWFRMEDATSGVTGSSVDEEVDSMIQQIKDVQGLSQDLEGFRPTGQVLIDGRPVDLNRIRELLRQVLSGQVAIATIIIR